MADDNGGTAPSTAPTPSPDPSTGPSVERPPAKSSALVERGKVLAAQARARAREAWIDFRRNSVYFQIKAGLVAAYVVIVLMTLVLAPPAPASFALTVGSLPWGVGKRTYVDLDNLDLGTLTDVVVEVQGRVIEFDGKESRGPWRMKLSRLKEGDTVRLWPEKLMTDQNRPAGDNLDVSRVRVYSADDPSNVLVDAAPTAKRD